MTYHQLTEHERYLISRLRKAAQPVAEIARVLDRHPSTIYREYQRNSTQVRNCLTYCPSKAQERRNGRLRRSRRGPRHEAWQYARSLLRQQWSPEQIAGTLGRQDEFRISFQSIYRHVRRDWRVGRQLYLELRRRYKRRSVTTAWNCGPFRTITSDNGTEFHAYPQIEAATGTLIYFARTSPARITRGSAGLTRTPMA